MGTIFKTESFLVNMKFEDIKESIVQDTALIAIELLLPILCMIDRFAANELSDIKIYRANTKNYHVRVLADNAFQDSFIVMRPKGLLKIWTAINPDEIPECISKEIFQVSCSKERRKKLINKVVELRAFW